VTTLWLSTSLSALRLATAWLSALRLSSLWLTASSLTALSSLVLIVVWIP